ncbi:MAG: GTP-binding protein [Burkholderiaceae bacterium]
MNAINESWVSAQGSDVLRLITAGSVDDGKSTLIGRLLYDSKGVFADQLASIERSKYKRTPASEIDLALLTDGLEAEREQGITIDVAYRYFATPLRKFIVADAPGHEQYTRNMVTGASTAQVAIVLIDASRAADGRLLPQTKRHSALAQLLGLRHVVVAVNKMDLVGWDGQVFQRIAQAYAELARALGIASFHIVPISALKGDNVVEASSNTPWYSGPTLLSLLEMLPVTAAAAHAEPRFFVQWVIRHAGSRADGFRGYAGQLAGGALKVGDELRVLPSGLTARVARLLRGAAEVDELVDGDSATVVLDRDVDVSRGDLIVPAGAQLRLAREFDAQLCWLDQQALSPARQYWLKQGSRLTRARIKAVHTRRDMQALRQVPAGDALSMNDIGHATLVVRDTLALDAYTGNAATGAFILIDAATHQTAAAGMVL